MNDQPTPPIREILTPSRRAIIPAEINATPIIAENLTEGTALPALDVQIRGRINKSDEQVQVDLLIARDDVPRIIRELAEKLIRLDLHTGHRS